MDPDANLEEQRRLQKKIQEPLTSYPHMADAGEELASAVGNLHVWVMNGGSLPTEWGMNCNGGLLNRAGLARHVFQTIIKETESLEGDLGLQAAYLLGAILDEGAVELHPDIGRDAQVLRILRGMFPEHHAVWGYIQIVTHPT